MIVDTVFVAPGPAREIPWIAVAGVAIAFLGLLAGLVRALLSIGEVQGRQKEAREHTDREIADLKQGLAAVRPSVTTGELDARFREVKGDVTNLGRRFEDMMGIMSRILEQLMKEQK